MAAPRASAAASGAVFRWSTELERDARMPQMQQLVEQILLANFPAVADKLRKEEPPARRYEPAPAPAVLAPTSSDGPSLELDAQGRGMLQLHGYSSESASEADSSREVDPMDDLSDFEPQPSPRERSSGRAKNSQQQHQQQQQQQQEQQTRVDAAAATAASEDHEMAEDVDMDADMAEEDETACVVCGSSENAEQTLLCDKCDEEYHLYCLTPPLAEVPQEETWFCPRCTAQQPPGAPAPHAAAAAAASPKREEVPISPTAQNPPQHTEASAAAPSPQQQVPTSQQPHQGTSLPQPNGQSNGFGSDPSAPQHQQPPPSEPPISVASAFESDAERSNQLLIHACQCDDVKCADPAFHEFCPSMKRFLRSACWASHSEQWRGFRVARATAELFAFHAMQCHEANCSVPMCDMLRGEEVV